MNILRKLGFRLLSICFVFVLMFGLAWVTGAIYTLLLSRPIAPIEDTVIIGFLLVGFANLLYQMFSEANDISEVLEKIYQIVVNRKKEPVETDDIGC